MLFLTAIYNSFDSHFVFWCFLVVDFQKNKTRESGYITSVSQVFCFGADGGDWTRDLRLTKYVYKIKEFCTHLQNSLFSAIFTPHFFKRSYAISKTVRPFTAVALISHLLRCLFLWFTMFSLKCFYIWILYWF
jgi:hypothetical protein